MFENTCWCGLLCLVASVISVGLGLAVLLGLCGAAQIAVTTISCTSSR